MTVFNKRGKLVLIILKILNECKQFISVGRGFLQEENSGRVVRGPHRNPFGRPPINELD